MYAKELRLLLSLGVLWLAGCSVTPERVSPPPLGLGQTTASVATAARSALSASPDAVLLVAATPRVSDVLRGAVSDALSREGLRQVAADAWLALLVDAQDQFQLADYVPLPRSALEQATHLVALDVQPQGSGYVLRASVLTLRPDAERGWRAGEVLPASAIRLPVDEVGLVTRPERRAVPAEARVFAEWPRPVQVAVAESPRGTVAWRPDAAPSLVRPVQPTPERVLDSSGAANDQPLTVCCREFPGERARDLEALLARAPGVESVLWQSQSSRRACYRLQLSGGVPRLERWLRAQLAGGRYQRLDLIPTGRAGEVELVMGAGFE